MGDEQICNLLPFWLQTFPFLLLHLLLLGLQLPVWLQNLPVLFRIVVVVVVAVVVVLARNLQRSPLLPDSLGLSGLGLGLELPLSLLADVVAALVVSPDFAIPLLAACYPAIFNVPYRVMSCNVACFVVCIKQREAPKLGSSESEKI